MIPWKRHSVYQLLCLFGDAREHGWMEVTNLGTRLFVNYPANGFKTHQDKFEAFLKKAVNYGLVDVIEPKEIETRRRNAPKVGIYIVSSKEDFNYKLSEKGDKLLRQEQAERESDNAFYYNLFDRSVDGKWGVDTFSPLTSTDYGVKEKHTYKAKDLQKDR